MNVQPYELHSIRHKRAWLEVADKLDLHITIVKEAYMNRWFRARETFFDSINKGEITRDEVIKEADCFMEFPLEELDRLEEKADECSRESDFSDKLQYKLKELIQVGDYIVSDETKTYCFSGKQYQTQGKKYKITNLSDWRCELTGFTAITNSDIKGEKIHWSNYGVRSLWRKGKEIWNWHLAYLEQFIEENPNHPDINQLKEHCQKGAERDRKGERE